MSRRNNSGEIFKLIYKFSALELWRNKIGLLLLFIIPSLFIAVAVWTAGQSIIPIKLYFVEKVETLFLSSKNISLVFMSAAVSGFLTAFYANILFHQDFNFFRYCVSNGLSPRTFVTARFSFFLSVTLALALFITLILRFVIPLHQPITTLIGFCLLGMVYGAYGGIVGVLCKDYLVALLLIILLANFDAGWLQNPVFYTYTQESRLIHWLPAFFPCQFLFAAIFTAQQNWWSGFMSGCYALLLLSILFLIVHQKMKGLYRGWNK